MWLILPHHCGGAAKVSTQDGAAKVQLKLSTYYPIGSYWEYEFPLCSGGAAKVSTKDGGLQDGNTGNGGATEQVHEVTNDGNPNEADLEFIMKEALTSYANKLIPTSFTKANLWKLNANMLNDADFDIWLPLASVHEVMVVPNIDGPGYTKETTRVEYEWEPPRCSTCLIFGNLVDDCPKASKRVVNRVDKEKGGSFGADVDGFTEVKKEKSKGTFSLSNSFEVLNVDNPGTKEVDPGNKASMYGVQEEDDMYEGQEIPDNIQSVCDKLDIK
nr:hypothetical protein [Tanacetum cinerariifolium]